MPVNGEPNPGILEEQLVFLTAKAPLRTLPFCLICMCFACMCVSVSNTNSTNGNQKRLSAPAAPWELELQPLWSHHVSVRNQTWILWKSSQCSELLSISGPPCTLQIFSLMLFCAFYQSLILIILSGLRSPGKSGHSACKYQMTHDKSMLINRFHCLSTFPHKKHSNFKIYR